MFSSCCANLANIIKTTLAINKSLMFQILLRIVHWFDSSSSVGRSGKLCPSWWAWRDLSRFSPYWDILNTKPSIVCVLPYLCSTLYKLNITVNTIVRINLPKGSLQKKNQKNFDKCQNCSDPLPPFKFWQKTISIFMPEKHFLTNSKNMWFYPPYP